MKKAHRIAPELKEQVLKRIKEEGIPITQVAKDHEIHETTIYGWLGSEARHAPSWVEVAKLKRENKALLELVGEITLKLSESPKKIDWQTEERQGGGCSNSNFGSQDVSSVGLSVRASMDSS